MWETKFQMPQLPIRSLLSGGALVIGFLLALAGLGYGYASAEHYGWLLRLWACFTLGAVALFVFALFIGPRWTRWPAIALLVLTLLVGLSPAQRLMFWGLFAP